MRIVLTRRNKKRQRGFTLVELLIVVGIMAVISVIATPALANLIGTGEEEAFEMDRHLIQKIVNLYYVAEDGTYPTYTGYAGKIDFDLLIAGGYLSEAPASAASRGSVSAASLEDWKKHVWYIDSNGTVVTTYTEYKNVVATNSVIVNLAFNEGGGDTAYDSSADETHNHSSTLNGATWTSGIVGSGLQFDGIDDYVAIPDLHYDTAGQITALTVSVWFKTTHKNGGNFDNWSFVDFDRSEYFNFFIAGNTGKLGFSTADTSRKIDDFYGNTSLNDGEWHYACAVFNGTDKILYVDGEEDARKENPHGGKMLGTGQYARYGFIGDGSEASSFDGSRNNKYYEGTIDELKVYNEYCLSADAINTQYHDLVGVVYESPLKLNLTFNDGEGDIASDSSVYENDATLYGPTWTRGKVGAALEFDGTNDYVAIQEMKYDSSGQIETLTVCAWFKTSHKKGGNFDNWSFVDFDRSEYFNFFITGNTGKLGFSTADTSRKIDDFYGNAVLNDGEWHFVCAVFDGTDKILYVDGQEDARKTNPHGGKMLGTGRYTRYGFIGDGSEASDFNGKRNNKYYEGLVDEVKIYNTVLSADSILSRYENVVNDPLANPIMINMPFDESDGDTAYDSSAYGNNGTLTNNPTWTTGQVGSALQFDGNDTYVEVSDDYTLDITDEITLEAWVNINNFSSAGYLMAKNYGSLDEMTYAVYIQTDEHLHIVLDDTMWDTGYVVPIGQWKHLVVTWDETTVRLYVDGTENWSDSHSGSLTPNDMTLVIGARNNNTGGTSYHFDGIIDELRIHERALLADEVQARYDETK